MKKKQKPVAKATKHKSWRDVIPIHPAADLFPLMTPDELREFADDLKATGLCSGVNIGRDGSVLDGRNRLDAMELLGVELLTPDGKLRPEYQRPDIKEGVPVDPVAFVISKNIRRRHLNQEQKRELLAKLLKLEPSKSNRQIAKTIGVDHKTVASVRAEAEGRGEIPHVETVTDTKGREQPAKKPTTNGHDDDDEIEVRNWTVPTKDYVALALKQNRSFANALARVRGIVLDKKLAAQLEPYADALDLIHDTLERIAGNIQFDGPCDFREVIEKKARRDKAFRNALNLIGFDNHQTHGKGKAAQPLADQEAAGHA